MIKKLSISAAVLALAVFGSPRGEAQSCGYHEYDVPGGHCVYSWCGATCHATDCVYSDGREYHSISSGCNVS
jgi:hypothetical protein